MVDAQHISAQLGADSRHRSVRSVRPFLSDLALGARARHDGGADLRVTLSRSTFKQHALAGWSALGSGESDEFATFAQGRTAWEDSAEVSCLTPKRGEGSSTAKG